MNQSDLYESVYVKLVIPEFFWYKYLQEVKYEPKNMWNLPLMKWVFKKNYSY